MQKVVQVLVVLVLVVSRYWRVRAYAQLPVTARALQGVAPYLGQARCLALGCWPQCFRRLDVKGGRRSFPEYFRRKREAPLILRGSTSPFRGHPRT